MPETTASVVRLARLKDAGTIAVMSRQLIEHGLPWRWQPGRVRHYIRHPESTVIVAEAGDSIRGFAILSFAETSAHLSLLAVDPSARRQGVATTMMRWLLESCRIAGIGRVSLEVRLQNQSAVQCYESLGFGRVGIKRGYYEGIEDAQLMICRLMSPENEAKRPG